MQCIKHTEKNRRNNLITYNIKNLPFQFCSKYHNPGKDESFVLGYLFLQIFKIMPFSVLFPGISTKKKRKKTLIKLHNSQYCYNFLTSNST